MAGGERQSFFAAFSVAHAIVANRLCFCAESRPRDGCRKMRVRKPRRLDYLLGLFSHSIVSIGACFAIYIRFSAIRRSLFHIFFFHAPPLHRVIYSCADYAAFRAQRSHVNARCAPFGVMGFIEFLFAIMNIISM